MSYWGSKLDVSHAFSPHLRVSHFDTAFITDNTFVSNFFILATITLIVFGWAEDAFAKKPVAFRFQGAVIDRLWLGNFTIRPTPDLVR
jgi:hypothetical protein